MKPIINALAMFLALEPSLVDVTLPQAMDIATRFVDENAELFAAPAPVFKTAPAPTQTRVVGGAALTPEQEAAIGTVGLCPNCQQPNNNHLPGCARQSGEDPRAVTKNPLPAASA